jgi:uncharacterized ferritin-like protein (DUF455 family)
MSSSRSASSPEPTLPVQTRARDLASLRQVLLRAADHACLWLIEEPDLDSKHLLGRRAWDLTWCANTLTGRLLQLRADEDLLDQPLVTSADGDMLAPLSAVGGASRLDRFERVFLPALDLACARLRRRCAPLLDEGSWAVLTQIRARLAQVPSPSSDQAEVLSSGAETTEFVALPPLTVPSPLVPGRFAEHPPTPGYDWPNPEEDTPGFLHAVAMGIEVCAAEVCAAMILRHPTMPPGLRVDLARQVCDEMRHAHLLLGRAAELGLRPFAIPYDNYTWDLLQPAETLLDKLTLEQRLGEGNGLDDAAAARDRFLKAGDTRTAAIFDFITADEVVHVRCGNHWIRTLLDDEQERVDVQEDEVRAKVAAAGMAVGYPRRPNVSLRRLAGFTDQEVARMINGAT